MTGRDEPREIFMEGTTSMIGHTPSDTRLRRKKQIDRGFYAISGQHSNVIGIEEGKKKDAQMEKNEGDASASVRFRVPFSPSTARRRR